MAVCSHSLIKGNMKRKSQLSMDKVSGGLHYEKQTKSEIEKSDFSFKCSENDSVLNSAKISCDNINKKTEISLNTSNTRFKKDLSNEQNLKYIQLCNFFKNVTKYASLIFLMWTVLNVRPVSAGPSSFFDFDFDFFGGRTYNAFSCGCLPGNNKQARIVGGSASPAGSSPWLVAITKGGRSHCGSALISREHLLTASHCIINISVDELLAWLGIYSLSEAQRSGAGMRIRKAYQHPHFTLSGFQNDIAVLKLEYAVQFTDTIRPICLPTKDHADYSGRTALVAGWGKTSERDGPSDIPRQALVQVWSKSKCRDSGYPAKRVSGEILCAGLSKGGVDACQGDSGGPLIMEASHGGMEVIGVVSWGRGCARPNYPGIYTRVASYLDFIHNIIDHSCSQR